MSNGESNEGFRDAPELGRSDENAASGSVALRCFRDQRGVLRAGLCRSGTPQADDDWRQGDALTDATDEAVARRTAGESDQVGALLGIAYERVRADWEAYRPVRVPNGLVEWDVRVAGAGGGKDDPGTTIEVLATSRRAVVAVAIMVLADRAAEGARATRRARPSGGS